ncbi:MAG: tetratricopeptide repeat protein [Bacteroidota bacterium]
MPYYKKIIFLFLLIFFLASGRGQNIAKVDSLLQILKGRQPDTAKVNALIELSREYLKIGDVSKIAECSNQALKLSENIKWEKGKAKSLNLIGVSYAYQGNIPQAINYILKSIAINEAIGDTEILPKSYSNLGNIYHQIGENSKALEFFDKSLKFCERTGNIKEMAAPCINIGILYTTKGDYELALKYFLKAEKIGIQFGDKRNQALAYVNMGNVYESRVDFNMALEYFYKALKILREQGDKFNEAIIYTNIGSNYTKLLDYNKALEYYFKGLVVHEQAGNKKAMASSYINVGNIYKSQKNYSKALYYFSKGMRLHEQIEDKMGMAESYSNIGSFYILMSGLNDNALDSAKHYHYKSLEICRQIEDRHLMLYNLKELGTILRVQNKPLEAIRFFKESLTLAKRIGAEKELSENYKNMAEVYNQLSDFKEAYNYYQLYTSIKDSIYSDHKQKELGKIEAGFEYEKELLLREKDQEKKDELMHENLKRQRLTTWSVAGGGSLALLLALVTLRGYRNKKRSHQLLSEQKNIIEEKNKDITDSINYARRIQQAVLREEEHVTKHLPEHFIFFKPKDIVSGDFYWGAEKNDYWYLAAVDCTGHGVPGAFMSMLGISFLNQIIAEDTLYTPAEVLNKLRERILQELRQTGKENENKDGMDISLIRLNMKTGELQWAGANNPIYIIQKEELITIKPDKQPIGYFFNMKPFTNHEFKMEKGNRLYLFTDGYADQFGGPEGKKFKYSALRNLLVSIQSFDMSKQKKFLQEAFENWKGKFEQVDDVCLIGVTV